jgi:PAS domain S-box-containing protein
MNPVSKSMPEPSQAELILQAMVASVPDIFFAKDNQGKYVLINEAAANWLNLTVEQVIGQTDEVLFPAETAQRIKAEDSRVLQSETPYRFEEEIIYQGEVRSLSTTKIVWRDSSGQPQGIIGISRDITEQKRTAQALQQSEELNQAILSALPDLIIRMDAEGTYLDVKVGNFPLSRLSEAKIGENVRDVLPPAAAEKRLEMVAQALRTRTMQCIEFSTEIDGETCWREVRMIPLSDREVIMSVRDFTKLNRAKVALAEALHKEQVIRKEAERANQVKDEFLTVISHELRTPLNPILGWASLLKRGTLSEDKVAKAIETIERNAKLQTQLIDDLLDIARMLRGKVTLEAKPVSLNRTIAQSLETVQLAAQAKALSIETQLAQEVLVRGDSVRLQQIVWNLLSNAVKFTPENGQISVRLFIVDHRACIQISDTGVGIRLEFLPYVFERFRQENSTLTRKFGGLGLGLAIVRQLCELHGGTVSVTSKGENSGTTFTVELPLIERTG